MLLYLAGLLIILAYTHFYIRIKINALYTPPFIPCTLAAS